MALPTSTLTTRPVEEQIQGLARYLRKCFGWEYANLVSLNVLGRGVRGRQAAALDTIGSGLAPKPWLQSAARQLLAQQLEANRRSCDLVYGLFPLLKVQDRGGTICSPLLIARLDIAHLAVEQAVAAPVLQVNRALLSRLLDDADAQPLIESLESLIGHSTFSKALIRELQQLVSGALSDVVWRGFDTYPLLCSQSVLQRASEQRTANTVVVCSGLVYLARRSRQSMGVLHELEQLSAGTAFSPSMRGLVADTGKPPVVDAPLNVLGALSTPQRKAIQAAREHTLSVVHGPPGTGKTHLLAMLVADQVANGGSVLVCARNGAAVDVVERFLGRLLRIEGAVVRGGSHGDLKQLKARLQAVLQQGYINFSEPTAPLQAICDVAKPSSQWQLAEALDLANSEMEHLDQQLQAVGDEFADMIDWHEGRADRLLRFRIWLSRTFGRSLPRLSDLSRQWRRMHRRRAEQAITKLQLQIQRNVVAVLEAQRRTLADLAASFTALEKNQRRLQQSIDYGVVTKTLPVWVSTLADVSQILPLRPNLFDLVIIDEGSQADIASALPALQRGRRAVVLGDEMQLRHVSFLPLALESQFREQHAPSGPSYRRHSVLDWINHRLESAAASAFLDEHFRSVPAIIEFSNREFYGGRLKLLTHDRREPGAVELQLVQVVDGKRLTDETNRVEAEAVIDCVLKLIKDPPADRLTIGIVSPFRAQVDCLQRLLNRRTSAIMREQHELVVGTAHELQGEERDVMLFSACVDEQSPAGSLAFLSRPEQLNVAITRARRSQWVFVSRPVEQFSSASLFGRYLMWVQTKNPVTAQGAAQSFHAAVDAILASLDLTGCTVRSSVCVGSVEIDILIQYEQRQFGIDLIGFEHETLHTGLRHYELELVYRLNLPVIPVTFLDWQQRREVVIEELQQALESLREAEL